MENEIGAWLFWIICAILYVQTLGCAFFMIKQMDHGDSWVLMALCWVVFDMLIAILLGIKFHWIVGVLTFVMMPLLSGVGLYGAAIIKEVIDLVFR